MVVPPISTPKWSFLVGKPKVVGDHYFRKPWYGKNFPTIFPNFRPWGTLQLHHLTSQPLRPAHWKGCWSKDLVAPGFPCANKWKGHRFLIRNDCQFASHFVGIQSFLGKGPWFNMIQLDWSKHQCLPSQKKVSLQIPKQKIAKHVLFTPPVSSHGKFIKIPPFSSDF